MVSRVGKFVGGFNADVTNLTNVHATENRVAFGHGDTNPTANVHVVGDILATTSITATGGFLVPNDGTIGSASDSDSIAIAADGVVTFTQALAHAGDFTIDAGGDVILDAAGNDVIVKNDGTEHFRFINSGGGHVIFSNPTANKDIIFRVNDGAPIAALTLDAASQNHRFHANFRVDDAIGLAGNTSPATNSFSLGKPANVVIRTHTASGSGNVIIGDATATSSHSLDVRGTANVGALTATTGTYSGRLVVDDTTEATSTTDGSLQTDGGLSVAGDAVFGDDIKLITDASVASFGVNGEITLTHVHNTGLLLEDSGGSPTLQFHDANESVSSDGSKLILTSNGVAFNLPTADGTADQVIKTDGSGTLSFADAATGDPDPAAILGSDTDCGTAVAAADGQDAFGVAIDDAFVELDLKTQAANKLGTVDMGALS